jgi:hypothetical protein
MRAATTLAVAGIATALTLVSASAQTVTSPLRGLADAYRDAVRLKSQIQTDQALEDLMRAQAAAVRAQTELLKQQNQPALTSPPVPDQAFIRAVRAVEDRYPDFEVYRAEAARLMGELDASRGPNLNLEHYIEGMYLVAKYASFSNVAKPTPKPVDVLMSDPEFHRLPMATRIRFVKAVAPELATFSDKDFETVLAGIASRVEKESK